jgi:protein involved in polysaccharide export with SLBB domain
MSPRLAVCAALSVCFGLAACTSGGGTEPFTPKERPSAQFPNIAYAAWTSDEPLYRLYPGDVLDVQTPSAPELSKTVTVQPDGRVSLPLLPPIMVADRSLMDAESIISRAYSSQLLRPQVVINVTAAPLKVFVGGEVDKPGVYDMPGDINALQAVIMAGGFKTSAKRDQVVIIRRGPGGQAMMRTANLLRGISDPSHTDAVPLRRFDVIYVPRTSVAEAGIFVQQYVRDLSPIQLGFNYALGPTAYVSGAVVR